MTDYAKDVQRLTEQLKAQESKKKKIQQELSEAEALIATTEKHLGHANALLAIESGAEVSVKNLRQWFDYQEDGLPAPEPLLIKLLDKGQLSVVEEYVAEQYRHPDHYSLRFFLRLIRESKDFAEIARRRSKIEAPVFFAAYRNLFEEKVLSPDFKMDRVAHIPPTDNEEVIFKLAKAHHRNVEDYCQDFEMLKKLVAVNHEVLYNVKTEVTGRVLKMRELVAINPLCAHFASSPIPANAGVSSKDNPEVRYTKILDWLRSTADKQAIKKLIPAQPSGTQPKKKPIRI